MIARVESVRRGLSLGLVAVGLALAAAGAGPVADSAVLPGVKGEDYAKGMALFKGFKNQEAVPFLEKAWAENPGNPTVLTELAYAYNNTGEDLDSKASEACYEKAVACSEKLRVLAPDRAETYFLLSMTYGNLAMFRGGREKVRLSREIEGLARKGVELDPTYSPNYAVLGVYYREVATLNPILRGFAKYLLGGLPSGTLEDSERMFLKSIATDPANVYGTYQLALTYGEMDRPDKAAAMYRKVLALPIVDHQDGKWRIAAQAWLDKRQGKGR